ncbi:hypothetical protein B484DRAFT_93409 [Ochromonadaceae sp. CCMP2298]|nr:hypothetical protein B484DRAFT_93409 [Ochromonadaceae sp. CCMP2298]
MGQAFLSEGVVKIRTRAHCSLVSSDKRVQAALRYQPLPLGKLPSSLMSGHVAALISKAAGPPPPEGRLLQATQDLCKAAPMELSRHFFVLARQLQRAMLAGTGAYSETFCNPYRHSPVRCQSFLTLLQIFGKIGPVSNEQEPLFLHAYVDYLLDEEVPLPLEDLLQSGLMSAGQAEQLGRALASMGHAAGTGVGAGVGGAGVGVGLGVGVGVGGLGSVMDRVKAVGVLVMHQEPDIPYPPSSPSSSLNFLSSKTCSLLPSSSKYASDVEVEGVEEGEGADEGIEEGEENRDSADTGKSGKSGKSRQSVDSEGRDGGEGGAPRRGRT